MGDITYFTWFFRTTIWLQCAILPKSSKSQSMTRHSQKKAGACHHFLRTKYPEYPMLCPPRTVMMRKSSFFPFGVLDPWRHKGVMNRGHQLAVYVTSRRKRHPILIPARYFLSRAEFSRTVDRLDLVSFAIGNRHLIISTIDMLIDKINGYDSNDLRWQLEPTRSLRNSQIEFSIVSLRRLVNARKQIDILESLTRQIWRSENGWKK